MFGTYVRTTLKYGESGKRYVHIEVGHATQNILLQVVSLNLKAVVIGAFYDYKVNNTLNMEKQIIPFYILPIGK